VLFEARFRAGIADGSISLTFRRWSRAQVVTGRRYRTAAGMIRVGTVTIVDPRTIGELEARRAGYPSVAALLDGLNGAPDLPVYRIGFDPVAGPDPRDELAADAELSEDDVAEIDRRLDRFDRASSHGAWTQAALAAIAARPAVRAADLAASLGRERASFKLDVRKLKALGLTLSLEVGYRLSARGKAYRARTARPAGAVRRTVDP